MVIMVFEPIPGSLHSAIAISKHSGFYRCLIIILFITYELNSGLYKYICLHPQLKSSLVPSCWQSDMWDFVK